MKSAGKPNMATTPQVQMAPMEPTHEDPTASALAMLGGARGITRTQTAYQTAITVQQPRNMKKVEDRILYEAAQMGVDFVYNWRVADKNSKEGDGKTTIEGMSIDGAMILARNWGNAVIPVDLMDETPTHFLLKAEFIDLETGFTFPRLFRQRKSAATVGRMDPDRGEDISFQIGQSKAQRNAIDKAMPRWLIDKAIEAAKSSAVEKYKDLDKWVPLAVGAFEKLGVTLEQLEQRVGFPRAAWTPYEVLALNMLHRSIRDKETSVAAEFPTDTPVDTKADTPAAKDDGKPSETPAKAQDKTADFKPYTCGVCDQLIETQDGHPNCKPKGAKP